MRLLAIKAREDQAMDFWHEVNKYWVAARSQRTACPRSVRAPFEEILTEVYVEIAEADGKPAYFKYEAGCRRMRENRRS